MDPMTNPAAPAPGNADAGANPTGTTPAPNTAPPGNSTPPVAPSNPVFTQADVDRIVTDRLSRETKKYADYDTVKERAAQWEKFQSESKPEQEKALDAARAEGAKQVRSELGGSLVRAHMTAAAAGRMGEAQVKALLDNVDAGRFLTEAGDADETRIKTFIDGIAPAVPTPVPGGFGQGHREGQVKPSLESGAAEWERRNAKGALPPLIT